MQNSALNYDKVMKPLTRAVDALKRDKNVKRECATIIRQMDKLESAAGKVTKFKSVVDEDSYDEKLKLLKALDAAGGEVANAALSLSKSLGDNPVVDGLLSALSDFRKQVSDNINEFESWFKKESKPGEFEFKVPRNVTDMIELADAKGRIAMPSDQSFDVSVTLSYGNIPNLGKLLEKNGKEFIGEIGRALDPLKKDLASAFKAWNAEFLEIEEEFDKPGADKLFKTINDWFSVKLPKLAQPALEGAVKQAVQDVCKQSDGIKDKWKEVDVDVKCKYDNIAEYVFKLPDNPADDVSKAVGKGVENLESTQKEYKEAVDSIVENHDSVDKALQALQKKLGDAQKKGSGGQAKVDLSEELAAVNKETGELETALKDGRKISSSLGKDLDDVKKKVDSSKGTLKSNQTIDKGAFDKLGKVLAETQATLKKQIPDQLTKLDELVKSIKKQHETITKVGGSDKNPPNADDLGKANKALEPVVKDFQKQKSGLATNLKLPAEADKLKSLVDSLKT